MRLHHLLLSAACFAATRSASAIPACAARATVRVTNAYLARATITAASTGSRRL